MVVEYKLSIDIQYLEATTLKTSLELGNSQMVDLPNADKKNLETLSWVVSSIVEKKRGVQQVP